MRLILSSPSNRVQGFIVHLCMLISRVGKRGLMDSIFIGYKVIPENELEEEEKKAIAERS